jgi:hypothetical protein
VVLALPHQFQVHQHTTQVVVVVNLLAVAQVVVGVTGVVVRVTTLRQILLELRIQAVAAVAVLQTVLLQPVMVVQVLLLFVT